jgi:RNA polymerase sigma-70 factor, ECF subfamily
MPVSPGASTRVAGAINPTPSTGIQAGSRSPVPDVLLVAPHPVTDPRIDGPTADDVRAAREGDAEAFTRLYDAHVAPLFAFCLGLTGNRQAATELVQDAFVRAWEAMPGFRAESAFGTWLHRIAVNLLYTEARTFRRRALRVAIEADLRSDGHLSPLDAVPAASHDTAVRLDIAESVSRLPAGARAVFVLHDLGGYTHAEIAGQLGIAEGTCKAHLFRARRLLRGMLDR